VNLDFVQTTAPHQCGAAATAGRAWRALTGHHELLFPMLAALVVKRWRRRDATEIVVVVDDMRLNGTWAIPPRGRRWRMPCPSKLSPALGRGDLFFPCPVVADLDDTAAVVVNVGIWATGPPAGLCIFFGLTPGSVPREIRPASAVNLVGRVTDDPCCLKLVKEGAPVRIEKKW